MVSQKTQNLSLTFTFNFSQNCWQAVKDQIFNLWLCSLISLPFSINQLFLSHPTRRLTNMLYIPSDYHSNTWPIIYSSCMMPSLILACCSNTLTDSSSSSSNFTFPNFHFLGSHCFHSSIAFPNPPLDWDRIMAARAHLSTTAASKTRADLLFSSDDGTNNASQGRGVPATRTNLVFRQQ